MTRNRAAWAAIAKSRAITESRARKAAPVPPPLPEGMGSTWVPQASMTLQLPLPPKVLSPNVKPKHWGAKANATKQYRETCAWIARTLMPKDWSGSRAVEINAEYRCSKNAYGYAARDVQNAIAAMKAGIDGLVDAGVMPNDSARWVTWGAFSVIPRQTPQGDGVTVVVVQR